MNTPPFRMPIPEDALSSSDFMYIIEIHSDIIHKLMRDHFYDINELPRPSAMAYLIEYYIYQVENGGHGQFLGNGSRYENFLTLVQDGLNELDAQPFLDLYLEFRRFLDADHVRADRIAEEGSFGKSEPEINRIDKEFLKLDRTIIWSKLGHFLRYRANLAPVQDGALQSTIEAIGKLNPNSHNRAQAIEAEKIKRYKSHPRYGLARILCEAAGRQIICISEGWQTGPADRIDGVLVSDGMVWMRGDNKFAILGLDLWDVLSKPRLPGRLAIARHNGVIWQAYQLNSFYRRLVRLTPLLRKLTQFFTIRSLRRALTSRWK